MARGNQTEFVDLGAGSLTAEVRRLADAEYMRRRDVAEEAGTPPLKNHHEGYGLLAERFTDLSAKMKSVKSTMGTALELLPSGVSAFVDQATNLYGETVEVAIATLDLALSAQRAVYELGMQRTPLEEMAEGGDEDSELTPTVVDDDLLPDEDDEEDAENE